MSILLIIVYTIIPLLVQNIDSADLTSVSGNRNGNLNDEHPISKRHSIRNIVRNKNDMCKDSLLIDKTYDKRFPRNASEEMNATESTLGHLKRVFSKFLLSKDKRNKREQSPLTGIKFNNRKLKRNESKKPEIGHKWNNWTKWSACSVTCGKGREIRWRHCKENCKDVEIEMEEKSCQLPACPQKLFGIINL